MSHLQKEFHHPHLDGPAGQPKPRCPYQRIRNKKFPWGPCDLFDLECWRELKKQQQQGGGGGREDLVGRGGWRGRGARECRQRFDYETGGGSVLLVTQQAAAARERGFLWGDFGGGGVGGGGLMGGARGSSRTKQRQERGWSRNFATRDGWEAGVAWGQEWRGIKKQQEGGQRRQGGRLSSWLK
jgi:hypothetical protein